MRRVYIVHGWGADSNSDWIPWLKKELQNTSFEVLAPDMPDSENPKIKSWVKKLQDVLSNIDENDILIGHSIGCQAIMRFLEQAGKKVSTIIFISPWLTLQNLEDEEWPIANPWIEMPINFEKVKNSGAKIIAIFSDNDPVVPVENEKMFKDNLNAQTRVYHNKGHFNADGGITEIPEILEYIE